MITKELKLSDLKRLARVCINHLDFLEKEEGKTFPYCDKQLRKLALDIASSFPEIVQFHLNNTE